MLKLSFQCFGMISRGKERLKILAPGTREEKARGVIADFQRAWQKCMLPHAGEVKIRDCLRLAIAKSEIRGSQGRIDA